MDVAGAVQALVQAQGVRREFFRKGRESARYFDAVARCDLALRAGELTVLVGRSGSGKSTLLNMLSGLLQPSEGLVRACGQDLYSLDDAALSRFRNRHFGIVPQGHTPIHSLTVAQNVALPYSLYRTDGEGERLALQVLERVGIVQLADAYPKELSGGELRRMAIARALVCGPDVVFADEPTGDLDDENTASVLGLLRETADAGAAVLMVTHEQSALPVADRVLRMDAGVLKCEE